MSLNPRVVTALIVVISIAYIAWELRHAERVEQIVLSHDSSAAARNNNYLAAARLLERLGHNVYPLTLLPDPLLLSPNDILLITTSSELLDAERAAAILDWVADGGYLVYAVSPRNRSASRAKDPLLHALGLERQALDAPLSLTTTVQLPHSDKDIFQIKITAHDVLTDTHALTHEPKYYSFDTLNYGSLLALTDIEILINDRLHELDHAELLAAIGSQAGSQGTIWIQYSPALASFFSIIWHYAWPLLCGLTLLIGALIWRYGRRFGPSIPDPEPINRSLLAHLQASGLYWLRQRRVDYLIAAARGRTQQLVMQNISGWNRMNRTDRIARLATQTAMTTEQIDAALFQPIAKRGEFITCIQALQSIEERLIQRQPPAR